MFTGLIEEVGVLRSVTSGGEMMVMNIGASLIMGDLKIGDSVAVNGVCLTATSLGDHHFTVDVMPETYRNSTLKELRTGGRMNLERAMAAGGRFGGILSRGMWMEPVRSAVSGATRTPWYSRLRRTANPCSNSSFPKAPSR